jgi:leucyl-tRNA---protein transferase
VFTELNGVHATELNEALGRIGFRRSQNVAYRPSCIDCKACVPVRILTNDFTPNATQRKILKRNHDLSVTACRPWSTNEQYDLLRRYLKQRHPSGGMADMDDMDYADMVEQTPVHSHVVEYRLPTRYGAQGELVGACITDQQSDGLSMVYSFYDAEALGRPGLGNFIIMDHILRAHDAGLPYVYLGYWVEGAPRMQYKTRYRPLEKLSPDGWVDFGDGDQGDLFA